MCMQAAVDRHDWVPQQQLGYDELLQCIELNPTASIPGNWKHVRW